MSADRRDLVERLRKAASVVYLACEKPVADDLAALLREAADQLAAPVGEPEEERHGR